MLWTEDSVTFLPCPVTIIINLSTKKSSSGARSYSILPQHNLAVAQWQFPLHWESSDLFPLISVNMMILKYVLITTYINDYTLYIVLSYQESRVSHIHSQAAWHCQFKLGIFRKFMDSSSNLLNKFYLHKYIVGESQTWIHSLLFLWSVRTIFPFKSNLYIILRSNRVHL